MVHGARRHLVLASVEDRLSSLTDEFDSGAYPTPLTSRSTSGRPPLNLLLTDNNTRILQSPRIRATDDQKATMKIGSKIPIATGSYSAPGIAATAAIGYAQTQFQYQDVGVNIEMTPSIHYDHDVTLKIKVEVSAVSGSSTIEGVTEPIISQRVVDQVIRLREGEASILGGIQNQQSQNNWNGIPGLSAIPILKYVFGSRTARFRMTISSSSSSLTSFARSSSIRPICASSTPAKVSPSICAMPAWQLRPRRSGLPFAPPRWSSLLSEVCRLKVSLKPRLKCSSNCVLIWRSKVALMPPPRQRLLLQLLRPQLLRPQLRRLNRKQLLLRLPLRPQPSRHHPRLLQRRPQLLLRLLPLLLLQPPRLRPSHPQPTAPPSRSTPQLRRPLLVPRSRFLSC